MYVCVHVSVACEPELMPSFPRYRNMKRKSSAAAEEKTKVKADFAAFGEPVGSVLVCHNAQFLLTSFLFGSYAGLESAPRKENTWM